MNKNPKVDAFIMTKKHPLTREMQAIREIILAVNDKVEEDIKWSAPTFIYKGNIASFFMNAKKHVSLMFHKGALLKDKYKLLEGDAKEGRVAKFSDLDDITKKKKALETLIKEWIKMRDAD